MEALLGQAMNDQANLLSVCPRRGAHRRFDPIGKHQDRHFAALRSRTGVPKILDTYLVCAALIHGLLVEETYQIGAVMLPDSVLQHFGKMIGASQPHPFVDMFEDE